MIATTPVIPLAPLELTNLASMPMHQCHTSDASC